MEFQSNNAELGLANLMFKNIFSNIRIGRTDSNGKETQIVVPCVFGQRSRIIKNLENPEKRGNMKVPMIAINRTGYTRNGDRLTNLHNEVQFELNRYQRKYDLMAPVPIDINYEVAVIAKYPSDIDKIASNFMVFFNSDIYVSCEHPKYQGLKLNNQVIMEDGVSEQHEDAFDGSQDDLMTTTFSFRFKTYLFAGTKQAKLIKPKVLSSYISSFVESNIVEIPPDKVDEFIQQHPDVALSASLTSWTTQQLTTYVDNPDISARVYDDIPIVSKIDFGFYVVPQKHDIEEYIQSVDNNFSHIDSALCGYISSEQYIKPSSLCINDPYMPDAISHGEPLSTCQSEYYKSSLSSVNDYYDVVDWDCSLQPYVDKLYWTIDGNVIQTMHN